MRVNIFQAAPRVSNWTRVTALGAFWGLSVASARVSLSAGLNPVVFAVYETALISLIGGLVVLARRTSISMGDDRLKLWAVNSCLIVVIPYLVSYTALTHLTAGEVTVVLALAPVMTSVLAVAIRIERWNWWVPVGAVLCLTAVALVAMTTSATGESNAAGRSWWVLIALLSPLCYAVANIYVVSRPVRTASEPVVNVLGTNIIACMLLSFILAIGTEIGMVHTREHIHMATALSFLALAAIANASANLLFFVSARHMSASVLALSGYLTTVFGILFGILLAGESWSWPLVAGGVLVVSGVFLGTRTPKAGS